jgi:prepilin signal peptidase PulO-like enzyme (type II secretory pathway)
VTDVLVALAGGGAALGAALGHLVRRGVWPLLRMSPPTFRAPWIEVAGAELFAIAGALRAKEIAAGAAMPAGVLVADAVFLTLLLALLSVDLVYKYLPDPLNYAGIVLGVTLSAAFPGAGVPRGDALVASLMGAAAGAGVLWALRFASSRLFGLETMGLGDVKLMGAVGAFLGPLAVLQSMLAGMLIGVVLGGFARLATGKPHFAFGPSLALGGMTVRLAGPRLVAAWRGYIEWTAQLGPNFALAVCAVGLVVCVGLVIRIRRRAEEIQREVDEDYERIDAQVEGAPDEGPPPPAWVWVLAILAPLGLLAWILAG